jgi:hypothetical protein
MEFRDTMTDIPRNIEKIAHLIRTIDIIIHPGSSEEF